MQLLLDSDPARLSEDDLLRFLATMPPSERLRIESERLLSRRREKALAYKLLWDFLQEPPLLGYSPTGSPLLLSHPHLHLSISHCRTAVAVALHDSPVGVDVESVRRCNDALLLRCFSPEEQTLINASPHRDSEFTRLWTRKEAYLKRLGTGIVGMDALRQTPPPFARLSSRPLPNDQGWLSLCW